MLHLRRTLLKQTIMRIQFLLAAILMVLIACQDKRYSESGPEIEAYKKSFDGLFSGNDDLFMDLYADTARIYYNSVSPLTPEEALFGMRQTLEQFSDYEYESGDYEFVTTYEGRQYLGFWGLFRGTLKENGETVRVPVHISARFVDGKVVEETGYWDNQIITNALEY